MKKQNSDRSVKKFMGCYLCALNDVFSLRSEMSNAPFHFNDMAVRGNHR
ncbi:MAG: hypothetical protein KAT34_16850 [Candidatus Aminicenantes bacterium]|nr:hypothetical protein [Candidatus Aminicenantes bacterium]